MAAVAQSGAREALSAYPSSPVSATCGDTSSLAHGDSPSSMRSPRCEAFVMTGDKILNLDHHVSPSYAKVARDQLPPSTQILEQQRPRPPQLAEFPSVRRSMRTSRIPTSRSQPEAVSAQRQVSCPDPVRSVILQASFRAARHRRSACQRPRWKARHRERRRLR